MKSTTASDISVMCISVMIYFNLFFQRDAHKGHEVMVLVSTVAKCKAGIAVSFQDP